MTIPAAGRYETTLSDPRTNRIFTLYIEDRAVGSPGL